MNKILWQPSKKSQTSSHMTAFMQFVNQTYQQHINDYAKLYTWSINNTADFWQAISAFCQVKFSQKASTIFQPAAKMQNSTWFADAKLNFAENLLSRHDNHTAIRYADETGARRTLSYHELSKQVNQLANYFKSLNILPGDRIVACLPNIPETVVAMLAATKIGALWSSCSPDFGLQGLLDRFGQIEPSVLLTVDGYHYNSKTFSEIEKINALQQQLPSLKKTILIPFVKQDVAASILANCILYQDCLQNDNPLAYIALPFDHPTYILYSSGTTGKPKCMVHGQGGTLLQHLKELKLHTNLNNSDTIFFFATCGWMMWNWLISSLALGATIVLYEGAPFYPKPQTLFDLIDELAITHFGVGAKLIEAAEKHHLLPRKTHSLQTVKTILTTGSPLVPASFDYIYHDVKSDVQLSSISGGSDIISCFALGNPVLPVYRGELQCLGLGMEVKIFNDQGHSVINEKGELVCTNAFPSMPICFWNDPDGSKYQHAYFDQYPNTWAHGDFAKINQHGGMIIYGRSDTTLNPGGVRIGTAEIYRQVEKVDEVLDCLAVGQAYQDSERILLFVVLRDGVKLDDTLTKKIKNIIRKNASPRHVPTEIYAVPDLPRTKSGKLVELAVKNIIHGEPAKNIEALANPEALDYFRHL